MVGPVILAIVLSAAPGAGEGAPGDALRLDPNPPPVLRQVDPADSPARDTPDPVVPRSTSESVRQALLIASALGSARPRRRGEPVAGESQVSRPIVVFVPGYGTDLGGLFATMAAHMALQPDDIAVFDYRWATGHESHSEAAAHASVDDAGEALLGFLSGLGATGRPLYLIGHSKGGAVLAHLVADWDADPARMPAGVLGAALLDPPLAAGGAGFLQTIGQYIFTAPNDGDYSPVRCDASGCADTRVDLGKAADVEVVVIRSKDAWITNFPDDPDGLRIIEFDDGGPHASTVGAASMIGRIAQAHHSMLFSPRVAACVADEVTAPGSCQWDTPHRRWRASGSANRLIGVR